MIEWLRAEAQAPVIELDGRSIPIEIKRHPRAKRLTLRLAPDGSCVRVSMPKWCASREAVAFAHARTAWLEAQLAKIPDVLSPASSGTLPFMGRSIALDWREDAPRKPQLVGETLVLGGPRDTLDKRLVRWLELQAGERFSADAAHYCARADLPCAPVRLTRAKRRWGSCSSEGVLRLNWRLIMAPDYVRRSVVAHEVAHLVHFDHSAEFHGLLDRLYEEDIRRPNHWLSQHGRTLYASFG